MGDLKVELQLNGIVADDNAGTIGLRIWVLQVQRILLLSQM